MVNLCIPIQGAGRKKQWCRAYMLLCLRQSRTQALLTRDMCDAVPKAVFCSDPRLVICSSTGFQARNWAAAFILWVYISELTQQVWMWSYRLGSVSPDLLELGTPRISWQRITRAAILSSMPKWHKCWPVVATWIHPLLSHHPERGAFAWPSALCLFQGYMSVQRMFKPQILWSRFPHLDLGNENPCCCKKNVRIWGTSVTNPLIPVFSP